MQNRPIPVNFAGWESDTYRLGRSGWQMAVETDPRRMIDRFMFHHKEIGLTATGFLNEPFRFMNLGRYAQAGDISREDGHIEICSIATVGNFQFRRMDLNLSRSYRADTEPIAVDVTEGELHRLPLFAELFAGRPEMQELIVEPEDVQQLLDKIVRLQAPGMREIRARDRKREEREPTTKQVHAQIITLKAA
jgi:hypothetical protein